MKYLISISLVSLFLSCYAQERVSPIVKEYGGIYEIPEATIKPDPSKDYKIVIDVYGGAEDKKDIDRSLNNVARMLNLHAVGGVPADKLKVVIALHGQSTYSTLSHEAYQKKFGVDNPNAGLMKALKDAGVRIAVCGQSMRSREVDSDDLLSEVEVAISMLTTITHYQNEGYMLLKF